MPYLTTPAGHEVYIYDPDAMYDLDAYLREYDRGFCWDCQTSPCDCPNECSQCEYVDCQCCSDCQDYPCACAPYTDTSDLLPWDYSPPDGYTFHGTGPAYYGMELEVSSRNDYDTLAMARRYLDTEHGTLGYLKSDSSVAGFELATEPMAYAWAMAHFPWDLLPALAAEDCYADTESNGLHVHVSRNAFSSPAHMFRWMKLFYRNRRHITRVARRSSGEWAAFRDEQRTGQFTHAKQRGRHYDETKSSRYAAINTTNAHTLEVRVSASSLDIAEAQSALQLVAATVEYTRTLTAHQVTAGDGWNWDAFREWLQLNETTYPALAAIEYRAYAREGMAA